MKRRENYEIKNENRTRSKIATPAESGIKIKNDKEKFKNEFKKRIYRFVLDLIAFTDKRSIVLSVAMKPRFGFLF